MRRHVHPLTPIIQAVSAIPATAFTAVVIVFAVDIPLPFPLIGLAVTLIVVVPLVTAGYGYLAWRRLWFWFDDDGDFRVDSGIFIRNQRRLQLSRLQAVDLIRPIIPRLLGFAAVVIEVAGTGDSRVQLRYLTMQQASALRAEVVARAAGLRPEQGEASEVPVTVVPNGRLALALLMRSSSAGLLLLTAMILTFTVLREGWGGLALALVTGSLPIALVVGEFIQYAGFTVTRSPDGLRLRFGLLQTQTRTVPPGRVQAIDIVEPLLWRRFGWVRVRVNIAGVGGGTDQGQRETLITPVSPRAEAEELLRAVFPGWAEHVPAWQAAPRRARWRAPVQWSQLAMAWTTDMFHARRGLVTRHHSVIPHSRTQSVRWHQGPWQRALNLATIAIDSTPGPVTVQALQQDAEVAKLVAHAQAERARRSRDREPCPQSNITSDGNAQM